MRTPREEFTESSKPKRVIRTLRTSWPAIFEFDGIYYQENYDIDHNERTWLEVPKDYAERNAEGD